MMVFNEQVVLGRSGLKVGRLGISSSYGAPTAAFEEAFEKGCNYFVLGSFPRGRSKGMIQAVHNIKEKGDRERNRSLQWSVTALYSAIRLWMCV